MEDNLPRRGTVTAHTSCEESSGSTLIGHDTIMLPVSERAALFVSKTYISGWPYPGFRRSNVFAFIASYAVSTARYWCYISQVTDEGRMLSSPSDRRRPAVKLPPRTIKVRSCGLDQQMQMQYPRLYAVPVYSIQASLQWHQHLAASTRG